MNKYFAYVKLQNGFITFNNATTDKHNSFCKANYARNNKYRTFLVS